MTWSPPRRSTSPYRPISNTTVARESQVSETNSVPTYKSNYWRPTSSWSPETSRQENRYRPKEGSDSKELAQPEAGPSRWNRPSPPPNHSQLHHRERSPGNHHHHHGRGYERENGHNQYRPPGDERRAKQVQPNRWRPDRGHEERGFIGRREFDARTANQGPPRGGWRARNGARDPQAAYEERGNGRPHDKGFYPPAPDSRWSSRDPPPSANSVGLGQRHDRGWNPPDSSRTEGRLDSYRPATSPENPSHRLGVRAKSPPPGEPRRTHPPPSRRRSFDESDTESMSSRSVSPYQRSPGKVSRSPIERDDDTFSRPAAKRPRHEVPGNRSYSSSRRKRSPSFLSDPDWTPPRDSAQAREPASTRSPPRGPAHHRTVANGHSIRSDDYRADSGSRDTRLPSPATNSAAKKEPQNASTLASEFQRYREGSQIWRRQGEDFDRPATILPASGPGRPPTPPLPQSPTEPFAPHANGQSQSTSEPASAPSDVTSLYNGAGQSKPEKRAIREGPISISFQESEQKPGWKSITPNQNASRRSIQDLFQQSHSFPPPSRQAEGSRPFEEAFQNEQSRYDHGRPNPRTDPPTTHHVNEHGPSTQSGVFRDPPRRNSLNGLSAPEMYLDEIAVKEGRYAAHLDTVAPYVQAAFSQWFAQGAAPALPAFLVHYLGRPPNTPELNQVQQLLDLRLRLSRDEAELRALHSQALDRFGRREEGVNGHQQIQGNASEWIPPLRQSEISFDIPMAPIPDTAGGFDSADPQPDMMPSQPPPNVTSSSAETYERLACVGEGTYGKVYKARNTQTGRYVALKRIRMGGEKDGFPVTAMREIKLLQGLKHPNVIRLIEIMVSKGSVHMVFEYSEHDLTGLLSHPSVQFSPANLKSLCHQMLSGLAYLHDRGILHRDMKGSNILLNADGELKLGDFGLARIYNKRRKDDYTNRVITLWYRSPELLLGETVYGPDVDIWSAGCIMLELFTTKPIFQGNDEIHQLEVIYSILGTPTEVEWPTMGDLPWYELVKPKERLPSRFRESFAKWLTPAGLDLAQGLLAFDHAQRVSAKEAMSSPYFVSEEPQMERPTQLRDIGEHHEMSAKQERHRRRQEGK